MTVLLCKKKANCRLVNSIPKEVTILDEANLTFLPKSIKNPADEFGKRNSVFDMSDTFIFYFYWIFN